MRKVLQSVSESQHWTTPNSREILGKYTCWEKLTNASSKVLSNEKQKTNLRHSFDREVVYLIFGSLWKQLKLISKTDKQEENPKCKIESVGRWFLRLFKNSFFFSKHMSPKVSLLKCMAKLIFHFFTRAEVSIFSTFVFLKGFLISFGRYHCLQKP